MSPRRLAHEERGVAHLTVSPRRLAHEERASPAARRDLVRALAVVVTDSLLLRLEATGPRLPLRRDARPRESVVSSIRKSDDANPHALDENQPGRLYTVPGGHTALKRLPFSSDPGPLGAGAFSYRISARRGAEHQRGVPDRSSGSYRIGREKIQRESIIDASRWRDANDTTRTNGSESDDYLKLPVPYRARNGNFQDTDELLQVKGITPEMYWGHEDKPSLADVLTARSRATVNINTAPAPVLSALGLSDAEISNIVQERTNNPYATVPGRFGGRRVTVGSTTFRIDAEGIVGGEPKARIVAIVQKSAAVAGTSPTVTVVSWRPMPLPPRRKSASHDDGSSAGITWRTTGSRCGRLPSERSSSSPWTGDLRCASQTGWCPHSGQAHPPRPGPSSLHRQGPRSARARARAAEMAPSTRRHVVFPSRRRHSFDWTTY